MSDKNLPFLQKAQGYVHLPVNAPNTGRTGADSRPAVFLDRDGVLVEDVGFLGVPAGLRVLPGVKQALRALATRFRLVVVTNQSGIARGKFSEDDLLAVHQELARLLGEDGAAIEAFYYCPHFREGSVPFYSVDCECRKPEPGMLLRAAEDLGIPLDGSFMVGDQPRDILAGLSAGTRGIIIGEGRDELPDSVAVASSLLQASGIILTGAPSNEVTTFSEADSPVEPTPAMPNYRGLL